MPNSDKEEGMDDHCKKGGCSTFSLDKGGQEGELRLFLPYNQLQKPKEQDKGREERWDGLLAITLSSAWLL